MYTCFDFNFSKPKLHYLNMISFFYKNQKVNTIDYKSEQHRLFYDYVLKGTRNRYRRRLYLQEKAKHFPTISLNSLHSLFLHLKI